MADITMKVSCFSCSCRSKKLKLWKTGISPNISSVDSDPYPSRGTHDLPSAVLGAVGHVTEPIHPVSVPTSSE